MRKTYFCPENETKVGIKRRTRIYIEIGFKIGIKSRIDIRIESRTEMEIENEAIITIRVAWTLDISVKSKFSSLNGDQYWNSKFEGLRQVTWCMQVQDAGHHSTMPLQRPLWRGAICRLRADVVTNAVTTSRADDFIHCSKHGASDSIRLKRSHWSMPAIRVEPNIFQFDGN
ncbi:hypothetical protein EVAR_18055_1 [Eumeta japonica]|uniref:Uncharacterized protein n=1 Tax=Eumeta variegata TaxID=151549 RepID=A0A4C1XV71_EUMVA|nr:hypothetical protein EVAR_18055_1 [Eumeta japonica]